MIDNPERFPFQPRDREGPVFSAPWEARAFAIVVRLNEAGLFAWSEWVEIFSAEIAASEHAREGHSDDYYECWVAAIEKLLARKGVLDSTMLAASARETLRNWPHPDHVARREPIARSPAIGDKAGR